MSTDATFWNDLAEEYAAKPVENPDAFERKIAITKSHMGPQSTVLDIGCGTGSLALRLAPHGAQIHGLDLSEEMIRIANRKAEAKQVDNVTFHVGPFDGTFTAFGPETLDGVCAYSILHLVPDREAALGQIFQLLKPGGFFISSTVCLGETWVPYRPILGMMRFLGKAPMVNIFPRRQLEAEVRDAGFEALEFPDVGSKATTAFMVARKPG